MPEQKKQMPKLKLLRGIEPADAFWDDVEALKSFSMDKRSDIIQKVLKWIPQKDIKKEYDEWTSSLSEEDKDKINRAIRLTMFLAKESIERKILDEDIREDFTEMGLDNDYIDYFLKKLKASEEDIREEVEKRKVYGIPPFVNLDWRIDNEISTNFKRNINKLSIILSYDYVDLNKEKKRQVFELDTDQLRAMIEILQEAYEVACECQKKIE